MLSRDDFLDLLTPERKTIILESIQMGLADYDDPANYGPSARRDHTPAVSATCRNCHIVARARRATTAMSDFRVQVIRGRILFTIEDKVRISFKKFDKRLRSRNYPTRQARAFVGQRRMDMEMPPEITNLVAGYKLSSAETDYEVFITCPSGNRNVWQLPLFGEEVIDFFTAAPRAPVIEEFKRRIVMKPEVAAQGGTDDIASSSNV